jgi:hypothetical protein
MRWLKLLLVGAVTVAAALGSDAAAAAPFARVPHDRAVIRGRATLDGASFDAPYLGAVVKRRGLVTPCQATLPPVRNGRYKIPVYAGSAEAGCGAPGAEVFLWTFVQEKIVYSSESVRWPGKSSTARFRPTFSIAAPNGGVGSIVGFAGEVFDRNGRRQPPGTRVEAFIGTTRCAVASVRHLDNFTGFSIDVVGPDSVPGCTVGATITFRVDGRLAVETAVNEPGHGNSLNLSLT